MFRKIVTDESFLFSPLGSSKSMDTETAKADRKKLDYVIKAKKTQFGSGNACRHNVISLAPIG